MAALCDGLRVDHVIGLFRTYGRPLVASHSSIRLTNPRSEAESSAHGPHVGRHRRDCRDLGVVLISFACR
jgi:hypothetical protein